MKKLFLFTLALLSTLSLRAETAVVDGIEWHYTVKGDGTAEIYKNPYAPAIPSDTSVALTIPPSLNGYTVTSIGDYAFYYCRSLPSIVIPDSVTSIGGSAFPGCSGLTSITIPDDVTSIGDRAFEGCSGLTSIELPDRVTFIGNQAFSWCTNLTSITICDGVTSIGDAAFSGCSSLKSITIPEGVTFIEGYTFSGCTNLTSVILPDSVTSISDTAFQNCSRLASITIPDNLTSIGVQTFSSCKDLQFTVSPNNERYSSNSGALLNKDGTILIRGPGNTSHYSIPERVTSIGDNAFQNCTSLTSITIPESVTSIGYYAFAGCSNLTSITIPDSVTSIGDWAFSNCSRLTEFQLPNKITYIGRYTFFSCTSLTSVSIPQGVVIIDEQAFYGCNSLTDVTLPDSVMTIGSDAFNNCTSLTSITIPNRVTSTGWYAFAGCSSLTEVVLSDHMIAIGPWTFASCSSLKSITIPESVISISGSAFASCDALTTMIFQGKPPKFDTAPNLSSAIGLYYPNYRSEWEAVIVDRKWNGLTMCELPVVMYKVEAKVLGSGEVSGTGYVNKGSSIILKATPAEGSTFIGWSGARTASTPEITVTPEADMVLVASFVDKTLADDYVKANGGISEEEVEKLKAEAVAAAIAQGDVVRMDELLKTVKDIALGEPVIEVTDEQVIVSITLNVSEDLESWEALLPANTTATVDEQSGIIRVVMDLPEDSSAAFYKFSVEEQKKE